MLMYVGMIEFFGSLKDLTIWNGATAHSDDCVIKRHNEYIIRQKWVIESIFTYAQSQKGVCLHLIIYKYELVIKGRSLVYCFRGIITEKTALFFAFGELAPKAILAVNLSTILIIDFPFLNSFNFYIAELVFARFVPFCIGE